ncbi:MAG: tyrosine-type recombinase/integrase [Pseudomonadota bacterium]
MPRPIFTTVADHNQNLANMVRLALATGMRRGALLGLQWQDLDFQRGHITLRGEEAKNGKTCTIPMTLQLATFS